MAHANYKVTIIDHDYHFTQYVAYVTASSKNQAIAKGAALAGQEKMRREWLRMGRDPAVETLLEPEIKLEVVTDFYELWEHRDQVIVTND